MRRLSKYELLVLSLMLVGLVAGFVGLMLDYNTLFRSSLLFLFAITFVFAVLIVFRLDRAANQQIRTRQQIYQVLYWLHGSDKLTTREAEQTRHDLREALLGTRGGYPSDVVKQFMRRTNRTADELFETQRLQFDRLHAVLEAHWEVLSQNDK
jgi:hypothetical protein